MERERDSQLDRLAGTLRDEGIAPERDLWPGIDAAITRREQAGRARRGLPWWGWAAAAAATVVLALGLGLATNRSGGGEPSPDRAPTPVAAMVSEAPVVTGGMESLDQALEQLQAALAADPENLSLSRLVLMVHKSRGELLRKTLTAGLRVG